VSAAVALIRSVAPALTPVQVAQVLVATADDLETPGRDDDTGAGQIDVLAALCSLGHCPSPATPSPSSPSLSASPAGSGSGSPSPSAGPTPTPTPGPNAAGPLRVAASVPSAPVVAGSAAAVTVRVTDAAGPVAGAQVAVASGDRTARGTTDAAGVVRLAVAPARTATWTVTAAQSGRAPARAEIVLSVVPKVTVRWHGSRVTVTVTPAVGQLVTVWTRADGAWVAGARHAVSSGAGTVTLAVASSDRARVTVSAASGLVAASSVRP